MNEVKQTVKGGFMAVMRVSVLLVENVSSVSESNLFFWFPSLQITWMTSPLATLIAQKYLSPEVCRHVHL